MSFCEDGVAIAIKSPIGELQICGCKMGMHYIKRSSQKLPNGYPCLDVWCEMIDTNTEDLPTCVQTCVAWFRSYFEMDKKTCAKRSDFVTKGEHPPICPKLGIPEFSWKVYTKVASEVKFGSSTSYSALAEKINHPNASRAVGTALKNNPFMLIIPCHRVIPKKGGVGSYNGGTECAPLKEWLLEYEKSLLED